jgi:hypothetical protein
MSEPVPPSKQALSEALSLSFEILQNIERNELPLADIALKTSRLARLLNDTDYENIMQFEVGGYPSTHKGITPEAWRSAKLAGRVFEQTDEDGNTKPLAHTQSISEFEQTINLTPTALQAARDADVSISSANPNQTVWTPSNNARERSVLILRHETAVRWLANSRKLIHRYVLLKHYELKFSGISDDIFSRLRTRVDSHVGKLVPESINKFSSVYNNLLSENPEDWSNAVHSCRRILKDLADSLYPPCEDRVVKEGKKSKTIKLGQDQYVNRLIAFIEAKTSSERFTAIVGSHLRFIGERLDSIVDASHKGSHSTITFLRGVTYSTEAYAWKGKHPNVRAVVGQVNCVLVRIRIGSFAPSPTRNIPGPGLSKPDLKHRCTRAVI